MPSIRAGQIVAFYLFDVAESIDLRTVPAHVGKPGVAARLAPKAAAPRYVQYEQPPLSFDGSVVDLPELEGFQVRFRAYDYGVISIALSKAYRGEWTDLLLVGQTLIESDEFEQHAESACRRVLARIGPALRGARDPLLSEDYLVYVVNELDPPMSADELLDKQSAIIAAMLRGERLSLSEQERSAILKHRLSYLSDDLVLPTWNAALVYDTPAGAAAALEIIEFANSQLLEFRYYDALLDEQLGVIYGRLEHPKWYDQWIGSRYTRAARQVHSLFIDVNELTDKTENALKFVGDIYAARLFALVADRLGLAGWKANVRDKLKTLDDVYRFVVEQSSMSRGQLLEVTIVLILVLELSLLLTGVMK